VELTYYSTKNYFMWQTIPYPGNPDATLSRMENMPRYNTFEAFANYSPCFFSIWRPTFMAGIIVRQQMTSYDALTKVDVNKIYDTRDLSLTIRYNFNVARSRYKGRGAANADKDRF